jgi:hypothetical protein
MIPLCALCQGQVVHRFQRVWVIVTQQPPPHLQHSFLEPPSPCKVTLRAKYQGEVPHRCQSVMVVIAQHVCPQA